MLLKRLLCYRNGILAAFVGALLWVGAGCGSGPTVAIVQGGSVDEMVVRAVSLAGGLEGIISDGDHVVIKPNLTAWRDRQAVATRVEVVRALVRLVRRTADCKVTIAEGAGDDLSRSFDGYGYTELGEELDVPLVDLTKDRMVTVRTDGLLGLKEYRLPATTHECDVLIDAAVLKTHVLTGVTLGMKNLFGLVPPPRMGLHDKIDGVLCDLVRIRRPDLVVIDATYAMEGQGPLDGKTVKMNMIIAGRDVVAVDTVATAVMGLPPERVGHIRLAGNSSLGESNLDRIRVVGMSLGKAVRQFDPPTTNVVVRRPNTKATSERVQALSDRIKKPRRRGRIYAHFNADRLTPDKVKYPHRKGRGFRVCIDQGKADVEFLVPYMTLYPENRPAALEEIQAWIAYNLDAE